MASGALPGLWQAYSASTLQHTVKSVLAQLLITLVESCITRTHSSLGRSAGLSNLRQIYILMMLRVQRPGIINQSGPHYSHTSSGWVPLPPS